MAVSSLYYNYHIQSERQAGFEILENVNTACFRNNVRAGGDLKDQGAKPSPFANKETEAQRTSVTELVHIRTQTRTQVP